MAKIRACHIERSRNAIKNDISNVFDLLCKLASLKLYFNPDNAQTDIPYSINFHQCILINNTL